MPRGDGSGPAGMGPMTGRAAGYCAGYPMPGFMNPYGGRGLGMAWGRGGGGGMGMAWRRGRGGGRGRGWGVGPYGYGTPYAPPSPPAYGTPYAPPSPPAYGGTPYAPPPPPAYGGAPPREQELDMLRTQADWLKDQMEAVTQRIQELEQKEQ